VAVGAGGKTFDDLLRRLAQVKPLPAASASPSGLPSKNVTSRVSLNDSVANSFANVSPLQYQRIRDVAAGGSPAVSGPRGLLTSALSSTPAKVVLNGMNTIGYPMRMVNSAIKEVKDALDTDPNTRAGWNDYWKQTSDPMFGFGRVVPMKGWGGRFVGFAGDLVTDPINWLTLGGAGALRSAGNLGARGIMRAGVRESLEAAGRLTPEGVATSSLRETLGVKTLVGHDGRLALAEEARRLGATAKEVKDINQWGKLRLPKDIAEVMGLSKSGLYIAGTGIRLPGTGLFADTLGYLGAGTRLGILRSNLGGRQLQSLFTRRGVNVETKNMRMLLAKGQLPESEVLYATTVLSADARSRAAENIVRDSLKRRAVDYAADVNVEETRGTVYRVMENPTGIVASVAERKAAEKVGEFFSKGWGEANARFSAIDEDYVARSINNFVPHVLADEAQIAFSKSFANPVLEQVMTYFKVNALDPQGSFKHRFITADQEFLGVSGSVHKGTIDGINAIAKEKLGFNLFETDIVRIMEKYANTLGGAAAQAEIMRVMKESNFLKYMGKVGAIDPDFLTSAKQELATLTKSLNDGASELSQGVDGIIGRMDKTFDEGYLAQAVARESVYAKAALDDFAVRLDEPKRNLGIEGPLRSDVGAVARIDSERLALQDAKAKLDVKAAQFSTLFDETNIAHEIMVLEHKRLGEALDVASAKLFALREGLEKGTLNLEQARALRLQSAEALRGAKQAASQYSSTLSDYEFWSDDFGTWFQESLKQVGTRIEDVTLEGKSMVKVTGTMLTAGLDISPKSKDILKRIIDPDERKVLPSGMGLNTNWVSSTFGTDSTPSISKQLIIEASPQLIGNKKLLEEMNSRFVSDSIVRGMSASDNSEALSSSLGWLTIRMLKEAERNGGLEAREALAKRLLNGETSHGKAWQRVKQQVETLREVEQTIKGASTRGGALQMTKLFGKEAVDATQTLATLTKQVNILNEEVATLGAAAGNNFSDIAQSSINSLDDYAQSVFRTNADITSASIAEYSGRADAIFDQMVENRVVTENEIFEMRAIIRYSLEEAQNAGLLNRKKLIDFHTKLRNDMGAFADAHAIKQGGKQDQGVRIQIEAKQRDIRKKQSQIDNIVNGRIGKNDYVRSVVAGLSGDLRTQNALVAETMQEYYVFNEAYYWFSAFQNLAPKGVVIPESVWSVLLANTAKSQDELITASLDEALRAKNIIGDIRSRVAMLDKGAHAGAFAGEIAMLPDNEYNLVNRFFGTLISGDEYKNLSDLDRIVSQDARFNTIKKELGDLVTGRAGARPRVAPNASQTTGVKGTVGVGLGSTSGRTDVSLLASKVYNAQSLTELRNAIRGFVSEMLMGATEAEPLLRSLDQIELSAKYTRDEIAKKIRGKGLSGKGKRDLKTEIRGDEFGLSGLYTAATKMTGRGTGNKVMEWFARAIGGEGDLGRVYTGVGGKYRTTGTFALNKYASSGDILMGQTMGPVYKLDNLGNTLYDDLGDPIVDFAMTGDIDAPLPKQYKFITEDSSHYGESYRRLSERRSKMRRLAQDTSVDPETAINRLDISEKTPDTLGPLSYIMALESQLDESRDALKQFNEGKLTPKKIKELEDGVLKVKGNANEAEKQIAKIMQDDYALFKSSRDPETVLWIQKTLSGDFAGRRPPNLPEKLVAAEKSLLDGRKEVERIESTHSYLTSKDRRTLHDFIRNLAGYNLGHNFETGAGGLRQLSETAVSPTARTKSIYRAQDFATIKKFADNVNDEVKRGLGDEAAAGQRGVGFGLQRVQRVSFVPEEVAQQLASKFDDYLYVKDGVTFSREMLAAFLSGNRDAQFGRAQNQVLQKAFDDLTLDVYKMVDDAVRDGDLFDPAESLVVMQTADAVGRAFPAETVLGTSLQPRQKVNLFPTMEVDGRTVPIVFDELEWDQLFARPRDVRQVRAQIVSKQAERKALWAKTFSKNLEKNTIKLDALDAEIEDLKIQLVRNDASKQMEMVKRARALRDYFDSPDNKIALGLKKDASPKKAFERWAELNAVGMSVRDTPEFFDARVAELDNAWQNSYEYAILAEHRAASGQAKTAASTFQTALYGGRAGQLVRQIDSLEKAHARYLEKAGSSIEDSLRKLERYAVEVVTEQGSQASAKAATRLNTSVESLAQMLREPVLGEPGAQTARSAVVAEVMEDYVREVNDVIRKSGLIDADIFGPSGLLRSATGEEIVTGKVQNVYASKILDALEARTKINRQRVEAQVAKPSRTKAGTEEFGTAQRKAFVGAGVSKGMLGLTQMYDQSVVFQVSEAGAMVKNYERAVKEADVAVELAGKELKEFEASVLAGKQTKKKSLEYVQGFLKARDNSRRAAEGARKASEDFAVAEAKFDSAVSAFDNRGPLRIEAREAYSRVENLRKLRNSMDASVKKMKQDKILGAEFETWSNDLEELFAKINTLASMPGEVDEINALRGVLIQVQEQRADYLMRYQQVAETKARIKSIESMKSDVKQLGALAWLNPSATADPNAFTWVNQLEKGFVRFGEQFPNLQADPRVVEIFENMYRLRDPAFARAMQRFLGEYTKFFKAWAVATPGFHVRNGISNGFAMFGGGGNPDSLSRSLVAFRKLKGAIDAESGNFDFEKYLLRLDPDEQVRVRGSYFAMMGSGGGLMSDVDLSAGSRLYSNRVTKGLQKMGMSADQHARFMLAYDGIDTGMDTMTAMARVKRFMVDYEDTSLADAYLRQIVPFWMWTSRNLPLQMQNVYLNPKPYRFYTALSNNFRDNEDTEKLPKYLREVGAFALPGGKTYFAPDLPFSRVGQQIEQVQDPKRLMADVNPLLRLPLEVMLSDKKFFNDVPFKEGLQPVSGVTGNIASYIAQPFGQGGTTKDGKRAITDKALYTFMNLLPSYGQYERLVPSVEGTYSKRPVSNRLGQLFGSPVRERTPEMEQSELRRRLFEIAKIRKEPDE
jgi:hypothetical protein